MPRYIAIEWDSREARIAVASLRGSEVGIEDAWSVPLGPREEGKTGHDPQIGDRINAALNHRGIKRADGLVAIGRTNVELKQLSFPPVPDEELPQMVRWQATREFHSLGENWPLDYLPLSGNSTEQRVVLAAAMSPELLEQVQQACQTAGLKALRVVLRPCAAASLFLRQPEANQEQVRLLIDLSADDADLTVLVNRDVVFLRTARLPNEGYTPAERARQLLAEIRRTLAAAHNQLGTRRVEAIYLCGTQAEHSGHVARMEQELGLPVRLFDPFAGLQIDRNLKGAMPENAGRFAALLGLLCDELQSAPHGLDFLNPHKPPAPPSRRKQYLMAGAGVAAVAAAVALFISYRLSTLEAEIKQLTAESTSLTKEVKESAELEKRVGEIRKWTASDIAWLDELRELAIELPPAQEVMLTQLRLSSRKEGGEMILEGVVKQPSAIDALEKSLRDQHHSVEGLGRHQESQIKNYGWRWKSSVVVTPQEKEDYLRRSKKTATGPAQAGQVTAAQKARP